MRCINRFFLLFLIISTLLLTGCETENIMQEVANAAQAINQAAPPTRALAGAVSAADSSTPFSTTTNPGSNLSAETSFPFGSGTTVSSPMNEDLSSGIGMGANQTISSSSNLAYPGLENHIQGTQITYSYSQVGNQCNLAEAANIRNKYGITVLNGKARSDNFATLTAGNWTSNQLATLDNILSRLPQQFRSCTRGFTLHERIIHHGDGKDLAGLGFDPIAISQYGITQKPFQHVIIHEMAHQYQAKNPNLARLWSRTFWNGDRPFRSSISDYGNTNPVEDMAECIAQFYENPFILRVRDPERYRFLEQYLPR